MGLKSTDGTAFRVAAGLVVSLAAHVALLAVLPPAPGRRAGDGGDAHVALSVVTPKGRAAGPAAAPPLEVGPGTRERAVRKAPVAARGARPSQPPPDEPLDGLRSPPGSAAAQGPGGAAGVNGAGPGEGLPVAAGGGGQGTGEPEAGRDARAAAADPPPASLAERRTGYAMLVRRAVEGSGRYPAVARRLRVEGRAVVKIRVDGAGRVTSVSLSETSDHAALDDAAVAFARRVPSLPPPPGGPIEVMVPVVFALR